jgi:hypothetical protein
VSREQERRPPDRESGAPANTDNQNPSKRFRHFEVSDSRKVAHAIASVDRAIKECGCRFCVASIEDINNHAIVAGFRDVA